MNQSPHVLSSATANRLRIIDILHICLNVNCTIIADSFFLQIKSGKCFCLFGDHVAFAAAASINLTYAGSFQIW
jgi:hypothetical protein